MAGGWKDQPVYVLSFRLFQYVHVGSHLAQCALLRYADVVPLPLREPSCHRVATITFKDVATLPDDVPWPKVAYMVDPKEYKVIGNICYSELNKASMPRWQNKRRFSVRWRNFCDII